MIFEWDGMTFDFIDNKWISLNIAMKGPRGSMMNKEVPEPWASKIQLAYDDSLKAAADLESRAKAPRVTKTAEQKSELAKIKQAIKEQPKRVKRKMIGGGFGLSGL